MESGKESQYAVRRRGQRQRGSGGDSVEREIGFNCMWRSFVFILINIFHFVFK